MKKPIVITVLLIITVLVAMNLIKLVQPSVKTQMAEHGEMQKSYTLDSMIIRKETVITSNLNGVLEAAATENEMVKKQKYVASVYESASDENTKKQLVEINNRIAEIENAINTATENYSDRYRVEHGIDTKMDEMRQAVETRNVAKITSLKSDVSMLNDRRNSVINGGKDTESMLYDLKQQKSQLEGKLSTVKEDLYAPESGIFCTKIDGYEEIINEQSTSNLTPDDYKNIKSMKPGAKKKGKQRAVCKIIDSFEWSVATIVTKNELSNLKIGDTVYLNIKDSDMEAEAVVSYISAPKNGEYVMVATSHTSCEWAIANRFLDVEFVRRRYSGLKVPVAALRVVDKQTGVYAVVDGLVKFKKVKVSYKDSKYAIVEEDNLSNDGLLLYDEIIISDGNYKAGTRIKR